MLFYTMLAATLLLAIIIIGVILWSAVITDPDEWLLLVRNGKLAASGVGIRAWRRPSDVVARFSSTVQRVAFQANAVSCEHVAVTVEGFALWSVSRKPGDALKAVSNLGLLNSDKDPRAVGMKHALSRPQYHAFQGYMCAEVQQFVSQMALNEVLLMEASKTTALVERLRTFMGDIGLEFGQLEIIAARLTDPRIAHNLAAAEREAVGLRAAQAEAAAQETIQLARMEQDARLALRSAEDRVAAAEAQLKAEEAESLVRRTRQMRDAETLRDVGMIAAEVDRNKDPAIRDFELSKLAIERATDSIRALPISEAKWISLGDNGPAGQMLGLAEAVRGFATKLQS